MTLPQLDALLRYWEQAPPLHEAFAAFVGIKSGTGAGASGAALIPADDSQDLMKDLLAAGFALPAGFTAAPLETPACPTNA